MAPFKLKFRMGSSRSTSQETDPDPQVNEALLNYQHHHSAAIGASSSTIDSTDCTSLGSIGANERRSLLPNKAYNLRLGYLDPRATACNDESSTESNTLPTTPPSSYEHMLDEANNANRKVITNKDSRRDSLNNPSNSILLLSLEHLSLSDTSTVQCTDPNCQQNYACNEQLVQQRQQEASLNKHNNFNEFVELSQTINQNRLNNDGEGAEYEDEHEVDTRKESIDSRELLISTKMTATTAAAASAAHDNLNLRDNCTRDCAQCESGHYSDECTDECNNSNSIKGNHGMSGNDFFDPLINHGGYCSGETHYNEENEENQMQDDCQGGQCDSDSDDGWSTHQQNSNCHQAQQQQPQTYDYNSQQTTQERTLTPEIISNKSSKEIYKDLAKKWGITCKMSDTCRCMECQGHYFDCEFDDNEHQKTDGGLGAGTPMFISEVMHGSACNIL